MRTLTYLLILSALAGSSCVSHSLRQDRTDIDTGDLKKAFHLWAHDRRHVPQEDAAAIRRLVLDSFTGARRKSVSAIRWISSTEAIAYGQWYSGNLGGGTSFFLLRKINGVWRIVRRQNDILS